MWTLIILAFAGGQGVAVHSVDFTNKTACLAAKAQLDEARFVRSSAGTVCVYTGD